MRLSRRLNLWINKNTGLAVVDKNQQDNICIVLQTLAKEQKMSAIHLEQIIVSSNLLEGGLSDKTSGKPLSHAFVDRITTHEAYFLRHAEAMRTIASVIAPQCIRKMGHFRVLSLPCAGGEEPYSLMMLMSEYGIDLAKVSIVGCDISGESIEKSRAAKYFNYTLRKIDNAFLQRHFDAHADGGYQVKQALRTAVHFMPLNILSPQQLTGKFDFIFCQNLLIYFDDPTRIKAIKNLIRFLSPDGHLMVDVAEASFLQNSVPGLSLHMQNISGLRTFGLNPKQEVIVEPKTTPKILPLGDRLQESKAQSLTPKVSHSEKSPRLDAEVKAHKKDALSSLKHSKYSKKTPGTLSKKSLLSEADEAYEGKALTMALALYIDAEKNQPDKTAHALLGQAKIYADREQDVKALEAAEASLSSDTRVTQLEPKETAEVHAIIGIILKKRELYSLADAHFLLVKKLAPEHAAVKLIQK